ncbi:MAG: Flp pilus assembly protein CpaB [Rhodocyclaceae bacterium]|nr:Flp pilus assembly protein CpaB [Rhodocyclaceae bacterium]
MRSSRALAMIVLSLIAGVAAVFVATQWLSSRAVQTVPVAVAARDADLGSTLNVTMVETVGWPRDAVPAGAFENGAALEGRVLKTNLVRGEPIVEAKLAPVGAKGGLSAVIKEGKRAVTVRVNEVVGVAGFALPGNYVDVMVNLPDNSNKSEPVSKIVLERILVLAVAQEANQDQTKPKVVNAVTLEVSPEEAEKIDLVRSVGTLSLVLRNQMDSSPVATGGAYKQDILRVTTTKPAAEPVAVQAPKKVHRRPRAAGPRPADRGNDVQIEVIRGLQKSNSQA